MSSQQKSSLKSAILQFGQMVGDIQNALVPSQPLSSSSSTARLASINKAIVDEQGRRILVHDSVQASRKEILNHLLDFLQQCPHATYEEWISQLHPENVANDDPKTIVIDHRFYVEDSDHRILWNENVGTTRSDVPARQNTSYSSKENT